MDDIPLWQTVLGLVGMLVWGALCGVPALALYSVASRVRGGGLRMGLLLVGLLVIWLPLVTAVCVWVISRLIGWNLTG